ncbi:hypothetical protein GCM10009094_46270 [Massilia aurea]
MAQRRGGAEHAFAPDLPNLERHAPFGYTKQGHQAIMGEIDMKNRVARFAQDLASFHPHLVELRQHLGEVVRGKCCE